jgi:hypothetical protein
MSHTNPRPRDTRSLDPFAAIFGGHLLGPDGRLSQSDLVISTGVIAEIGCHPAGATLIDATGLQVRLRGATQPLAPGIAADLGACRAGRHDALTRHPGRPAAALATAAPSRWHTPGDAERSWRRATWGVGGR